MILKITSIMNILGILIKALKFFEDPTWLSVVDNIHLKSVKL